MLDEDQIEKLIAKYRRERDRFDKLAATVTRELRSSLNDKGVRHLLAFRTKEPESLRAKQRGDEKKTNLVYDDMKEELCPSLLDLAGARVLLYRDMGMVTSKDARWVVLGLTVPIEAGILGVRLDQSA